MFIGHYAPAFVIKSVKKDIPLWLLFLAVQLVDIAWASLVLLGIEKVRIVPGITASNPLDLYYFPFTHSLLAAIVWSGIAFALFKALPKFRGTRGAALLVGVGVFSHWVLDLFVHTRDLPLYDDVLKVGLGLWNYPILAMVLEGGLLVGGILLYFGSTTARSRFGKYGVVVFGLVMLVIQVSSVFGPPPRSPQALALVMLVCYFGFAGIAFWLEGKRL
jgi:hypothetical protein